MLFGYQTKPNVLIITEGSSEWDHFHEKRTTLPSARIVGIYQLSTFLSIIGLLTGNKLSLSHS
jgi:hypothetical protein